MRLLITGSNGFIGSRLIERLKADHIQFDIIRRSESNSNETGAINLVWPNGISTLDLKPYSSVIHLAALPATQGAETILREANLKPVQYFLDRISESNPDCSLIFVTSQSAKADTDSIYGRLKWEAEKLIRASSVKWTILRPGLVVGPGGKGLFNRLLTVVDKFPIIPLVGNGEQLLQPIGVEEVVNALVKVAYDPRKYSRKDYPLAGKPVSLKNFLQESASILDKKRTFIPIPTQIVDLGLGVLEKLLSNPPITRTNLKGLLNLELINSDSTTAELELTIPTLRKTLENVLDSSFNSPMEIEARYFYQTLFGKLPNRLLIDRYIAAHQFCCFVQDPKQEINLLEICKNKLDAESIEYATRSRKTLLTKKLTLLSYLAEIEATNYSTFVNTKQNFIGGFILLGLAVLRAPWKLIKGKYLVWRYNLV
jgi:nucleoside-diphosphate-sugar epimerase